MNQKQFDVFLCHNSKDKPLVIEIAEALEKRGLKPWIDKSDIEPGHTFIKAIQQAIPQSKSAAIFFGLDGIGPWQDKEITALQQQKNIQLIPVLLPGVSKIPDDYLLLQGHHWLPLESKKITKQFLDKFERGIREPLPRITIPPDDLRSTIDGIDYERLRDLLEEENWEEADAETLRLMLKVAGRETKGWLDRKSIKRFPCQDLLTIDKLWKRYSNGHFGFSVQRRIWEEGKRYTGFCDRVGWRVEGKLIDYPKDVKFSTSAPRGHLPAKVVLEKLPLNDYLSIMILEVLTWGICFVATAGLIIINYLLYDGASEESPMYGKRWTPLVSRLEECNIL